MCIVHPISNLHMYSEFGSQKNFIWGGGRGQIMIAENSGQTSNIYVHRTPDQQLTHVQ